MVKRITPTDVISTGSKKRKLTKEDSKKSKDSSSDSDDDNKKKKVKDKEKDKKKEKDEKGEKKKDKKKDKKKKKQALSSSDDDDDDETSKAAKAIAKKSKTPGQIVSIIHAPDTWEGQGDMSYREVTVEPGPKEYAFVAKPSEASVAAKHINDSSGHKVGVFWNEWETEGRGSKEGVVNVVVVLWLWVKPLLHTPSTSLETYHCSTKSDVDQILVTSMSIYSVAH